MADYSDEKATVLELIEEFGEVSQLVRTVSGPPADSQKAWNPGAPVVTTTSVHAAYVSESIIRRESLVKQGELFVLIPAVDLSFVPDPSTDAVVRASGARYAVLAVDVVAPSGDPIVYELKVQA